jgi:hypothetical protein
MCCVVGFAAAAAGGWGSTVLPSSLLLPASLVHLMMAVSQHPWHLWWRSVHQFIADFPQPLTDMHGGWMATARRHRSTGRWCQRVCKGSGVCARVARQARPVLMASCPWSCPILNVNRIFCKADPHPLTGVGALRRCSTQAQLRVCASCPRCILRPSGDFASPGGFSPGIPIPWSPHHLSCAGLL